MGDNKCTIQPSASDRRPSVTENPTNAGQVKGNKQTKGNITEPQRATLCYYSYTCTDDITNRIPTLTDITNQIPTLTLLRRMQKQGWPLSLCRWVKSYLTQRRVRVKYKDGVTDEKLVECGVPQGSSLSPLIFTLYISTLIRDGTPNSRFGYADDIAIVRICNSPREEVAAAQEELDKLIELASAHMIGFDPSKAELVIGGGPKKKLDASDLSVRVGDQHITLSPHI